MNKKSLMLALILSIALESTCSPADAEYSTLYDAIHSSGAIRDYVLNATEQITSNLGTMTTGTLTIDGTEENHYGILGKYNNNQYSGVTVNSGSTLVIKNIGHADVNYETGQVTYTSGNAIESFKKSGGGAIYNNGILTLDDVIFYGNNANNNLGSSVYNNGHITSFTGKMINGQNGAAIYTKGADAVIDYIEADFINNSGTSHGGAINVETNAKILNINKSNFIGNVAKSSGGAIRLNMSSTMNTGSEITINNSLFRYNSARQGGAIQNGNASTTTINNSSFDKNYSINRDSSTKTGGGGAIYNDGDLFLTDTNFTNNATTYEGGAIYASVYQPNPSSSVNIFAKEKDVLFTNNISKASSVSYSVDEGFSVIGGKYNDFYGTNKASLYLNANSGKNIIFNGSVVSNGPAFDINADNDDNIKGGTYNFNNTVEAANMTIHNGADIKLGSYKQADNSTTYGKITASNFSNDGNGGILDSKNSAVQELNLGNVTLNSDLSWIMDAQLKGGAVTVSDNLKANSFSGTGNIIINGINILEDSDIPVMKSLVADNVLKDHIQLSTTAEITKETPVSYNYAITYDDGYLNFSKAYNLVTATRDTAAQRVYNMSSDEDIALDIADIGDSSTSIGVMGGDGSTFTINGGGNSVNGAGNSGISILDDQTLNINNVGMDANGSVKGNGFYGFNGNDENNVLNNQGTLNIVNSVFKNNDHQDTNSNYPYGTVIYNSESGRLSVKNSLFEANNNYNQGKGTLTNDGYAVISNSEFKDNYTRIYGGSINNRAKMIIGNGEENAVTKFVDNTRASLYGIGGIENRGGKLLVNEKTEFINNKGAISVDKLEYNGTTYNSTVLFDAESLFKDNSNIALNTQAGSTYVTFAQKAVFDGNSGSDAGAAKIQTSSKVLFFDSVFKNNSSTGSGGAISNGGDLYLIANNGNVEFTGNKANDVSRAVYNNGIMYLNAAGGKSIIFNDDISGANNNDIRINSSGLEYRTLDSGLNDITKSITQKGGNYVFNANVENANMKLYNDATVTVGSSGGLNLAQLTSQNQGGTLDVLNNSIQTFTLGYVDIRNKDVNLKIDVNGNELAADKFVITNTDNNARVNFLISDIKFADGISDFGLEKKIRVLENPTERVGIKLSDALSDQYNVDNYQDIVEGNKKIEAVTSGGVTTASVNYNEHYGEFSRTDTVHKQLQVTKFDDNSKVDDALWWKEVSRTEGVATYDKDTLALINQSITDSDEVVKERSFNFTGTPTSEYKAISDAGVTAIGEFTINGVNNNNSIINFDGYKGFEVTDTAEKTTVNVNNVTIKGASLVANIAQGNELNLTNSIIDTGNTGGISNAGTLNVISSTINKDISGEGTTNFSGTSLNTATVTQSAASNIGTLTNRGTISTIANNAGTIDNYSIITAAQVNDGILNNSNGASVGNLSLNDGKVFNSGDVTTLGVNGGEFTNNTDGEVITLNQSAGTAVNKGKITAVTQTGGTFTNEESNGDVSTLTQSGGTSSNNGLIATLTLNGGTASNSGTITNAAVNQSTLTNNSDGEIVNLTNAATVANAGKITGTLNNTGTISDGGTITTANGINSGTITQNSLTSTGIFTNTGMISVDTLNNSGTFTNNDGGKITAAGSAVNTGSLTTNASDFKATTGLTNTGELYLTGGETQNTISGVGGTTHVKGNVIISKTISDNVISLDTVSDNVNGVARLGVNDISSAEKLLANGGDLSLQYQTGTEEYKLGNVDMQSAMGLAIDVNLTGSSAVKQADNIKADAVQGDAKILINNLKIRAPQSGDASPEYAKVSDNNLKNNIELGNNTKTKVDSITEKGFMITYAKDLEGENTGGYLKLQYTDLVSASRDLSSSKVYVMGGDENIASQLDGDPVGTGLGGSGINDASHPLGGQALTVNGNGTQSIIGGTLASGDKAGGFVVGEDQTLSINDVKDIKDFTTGIDNNGTVNLENVSMSNNEVDVNNDGTLNLRGEDNLDTVTGDGDTVISTYTDADGNKVKGDVTINDSLEQGSLTLSTEDDKLTNNGTVSVDSLTNAGTVDNQGTLTVKGGENNGTISGDNGETTIDGKFTNNSAITQKDITVTDSATEDKPFNNNGSIVSDTFTNNGYTNNGTNGTISADTITNEGTLITDASNLTSTNGKPVTNNGELEFTSGTNNNDIEGDGETVVSGDVENVANINNDVTVNSDGTLNNNGGSLGGAGKTVTNDGTIANDGNITGTAVNNGALTNDGNVEGEVVNNNTINNNLSIDGDVTNNGNGKIANSVGASITGGMDNKGVVDNDGNIISTNGKSIENSGTINNTGDLNGKINNASDGVINTTVKGLDGVITNNGDIHYTTGGSTITDIAGDGTVHLDSPDTLVLNNDLDRNTLSLNNGTLVFGSNKDISKGGFIGNGGAIGNVLDGKTLTYKLGNANLVKDTKVDGIDFDLSNLTSDKFIANFTGNGKLNIDKVQVKGNTLKDSIRVYLGDTTKVDKNHLNVKNQKLPTIMTPIRRLAGRVEDNYLTYAGTGNSAKDFNPAILASPVATLIGGQITQSQTLQDSFFHMNRYMKYSSNARIASEDRNKYASSDLHPYPTYVRSSLPETSQAMWVKPYTTFEKVNLKGGVGVSNTAYGTLYGGDTDLVNLGHGYKGVISAFVGYNGSHQSYNGISMNQQGGTLGVTGTLYHGNFFTGLTLSAGASAGEAHTPYGTDHFTMLTAGIANKTGYNIELADGKFIIQPSLYLGYTFVNNFDYKNSAGVNIDSDPLSTIQIAPGIKFIGNLKNGWQPYAGVDMMWNIMGRTKFKAADSRLPELSVKPYVQYGVGLQKSWSDRFTAFFQTMLRNGGRTGIVLEGGFRWTFGGSKKPQTKAQEKNNNTGNIKVIKHYTSTPVEAKVKGNTMTIIKPPSPTLAPIKTKVNNFTSRMDGSNDVVKYQNGNKKVLKRYYDISKDKRVRIVVTTDI